MPRLSAAGNSENRCAGLLLILLELRTSHLAVTYEVRRVISLGTEPPGPIAN